ncbi:MAG: protein kinase [Rubripirellula sp.]
MNDPQSVRHQIDLICDEFEQTQAAGAEQELASWLARVAPAHQETLFRELFKLILDYDSRNGKKTDHDAIGRSFPQFRSVIAELTASDDIEATLDSGADAVPQQDEAFATELTPRTPSRPPTIARGIKVKYVGDYEIIDEIARGGMGVVYRAKQKSLNREVALKMILSGALAGEHEVARFRSEAEAAANLDHPGIVPIYEVGQHDDQHYFSMGLVEGPSLSQVLREGPMQQERAAKLVEQVARAIDYAHGRDVIHRDLKPGNILLTPEGLPQVTDFGLAKRMSSNEELTTTGQVIGTPAYMPPEQARGDLENIGPASDIYSLGAILYAVLSGRPPHNANSAIETLQQVMDVEPISVRSLNPAVPKDLETICARCLDKEPGRRYPSAGELADELGRFLRGEPIHARPVSTAERMYRWAKRHPGLAGLSAAVLLLTATLAVGGPLAALTQSRLKTAAQQNEQRANRLAESERESREQVEAGQAELAAEKDRSDHALYARTISLAHQQWQSGNLTSAEDMLASLPVERRGFEWDYVNSLCHQELHQFTGLRGNPRHAAMTPDQEHVIVSEPGKEPTMLVFKIGSTQPLEIRSIAVVAISKDGRRVATVDPKNLGSMKIIEPITGEVLSEFDVDKRITSYASFGGPNDSLLAAAFNDQTVRVIDTSDGKTLLNIKEVGRRMLHYVALSPDAKQLAWRRSDDGVIEIRSMKDGVKLYEGPRSALQSVYPIAFSPDGKTIAVGGPGSAQVLRASDGEPIGFLDGLKGAALSLAFSPDGGRIAVTCEDGMVRVYDATQRRLLTKLIGHKAGQVYGVLSVSFDASGDRIISCGTNGVIKVWDAWNGDRDAISGAPYAEYVLPFSSQEVDYLTNFSDRVEGVRVSDDGKYLLTACRDRSVAVYDTKTDKLIRQWNDTGESMGTADIEGDVVVAGGGSLTDSGPGKVYAWSLSSGDELWRHEDALGQISRVEIFDDGKLVAVSVGSQQGASGELFVLDAKTGKRVWKSEAISSMIRDFAISPNGEWIATVGFEQGVHAHMAKTGEYVGRGSKGAVFSIDISSDGKQIALGTADWTVAVIDENTKEEIWSSVRHNGAVMDVKFAADNTRVISTSIDGTVRIWDAKYGDLLLTLEDTGTENYEIGVSNSGNLIAVGGRDAAVKMWRNSQASESETKQWITLIEDKFDREEVGGDWKHVSGKWEIENGQLKGVSGPSVSIPGTNEAMITRASLLPGDVDVSYDIRIDSPTMIQALLSDGGAQNMLAADFIGIEGTHLNRGTTGVSIATVTHGKYGEVVSRRGGGFEFEPNKVYRHRVRRVGDQLELHIDGKLYRATEVGMDAPTPNLTFQSLFGKAGSVIWIDNVTVQVPVGCEVELQANKVVAGLFELLQLKPLVHNGLEVATAERLLENAESEPFAVPDAEQVREFATQLANDWPEAADAFAKIATMAANNNRTQTQFKTLHKWAIEQTPVETDEKLWVQAMVAIRGGDIDAAKIALLKAHKRYRSHHGTPHPTGLSLRALVNQATGNTELAEQNLRDAKQLILADRWKDKTEITRWVKIAEESIGSSESDSDATTLAQRVWEIDTARMLRSNTQPLDDAVSEDAVAVWRRDADSDQYLHSVPRERWIESERFWNRASSIGVHVIRSHVDVDMKADEPVVTSHYAFEMPGMFFTYVQLDTFRRQDGVAADQWKIFKRDSRVTRWFHRGTIHDMQRDGWNALDQRVTDAEASGEISKITTALSMACRPEECFQKTRGLLEDAKQGRELVQLVEAAYGAHRPEVANQAAKKAIEMDPEVSSLPVMRYIAAKQLAAKEYSAFGDNISIRPPSFYRQASKNLLAAGPAGVAAWQPTIDSLFGVFRHQGVSIADMEIATLASRKGPLKCELLEQRAMTVDGYPARTLVFSGKGIGRAVAYGGKPTMQRFVIIQREDDLVAIVVSSFSDEFIFRDSEAKSVIETMKLKVQNDD